MAKKIIRKLGSIVVDPIVEVFMKLKIDPNTISLFGLFLNLLVSMIFSKAAYAGVNDRCFYLRLAGAGILFAGAFDLIDGQVARKTNKVTKFGAFFDSVLDRYSELFTYLGIGSFFTITNNLYCSLITFFALVGSYLVSYTRARAESINVQCSIGLMTREVRIVLLGTGALLCGVMPLSSPEDPSALSSKHIIFNDYLPLTFSLFFIAFLSNLTAIVRIKHVYRQLGDS